MATEPTFMDCPLVTWIDTFRKPGSGKLTYSDLYDGVFLSDVMQDIDPRPAHQDVVRTVRDSNIRLQNWDILLKNIRAYYSEVLQQLIIMKLPNIHMISREPEKDASFNELKKVLLLILGCAVQCEHKEEYIQTIQGLDIEVQHELAESIQQITDDSVTILPRECQDTDKLFSHLIHVISERDDYAEVMSELAQERDFYQAQSEGKTLPMSPTGSPEKHSMVVELTELKARVRKLKQELDDKQEHLSDLRDEYEDQKNQLTKLRNENVSLLKDARSARALRDEIDILREKMGKVNNYEAEILKYKERLNEMEFYKARVEELRDDNAILIENKGLLEEQLNSCHQRIETVVQLEKELVKYRQHIEDMSTERDQDRERIRVLAEENAQLQFHKKTSMNENATLEEEIAATKAKIAGIGGAISDQLKETTNAKILRLELENQHLLRKIEDMRESSLIENTALNLQLEKENQRLSAKIEKLQHENKEKGQKVYDFEEQTRRLLQEKEQFSHTIELAKDSAERQIKELEQQNEDLAQTVEILRTRNEQTSDTKTKDLERENKRIHETLSVKNQHLSKLEFENRQLQKTQNRNKENVKRISELENEKEHLERENLELRHTVQAQELTCEKVDKLEQENSDLDVENQKLQKKINNLQTAIDKKEKLEQENINFRVENQKLQRMLENSKHSNSRIADLENEKSLLKKELQQSQKTIESKKAQNLKMEKMELDLSDLDNENMKLQRQLEITTNRVQQLEKDNADLEAESEKLQESIESSKYSQKRVTDLEKQNMTLEEEITKFQKDNSRLTKENKRNKVTLETRESTIDDLTTKLSMMELDYKELKRSVERERGSSVYSQQSEKEHKELLQTLQIEKQTVAKLRTELMNEKIRSQELNNDLEKTTQDLEKLGIKKSDISVAALSPDNESRFKAMQSMMEETLKKSLDIKKDKIDALETRLEESKNRNLKLADELRITRRECESLKQRYEEESLGKEKESVGLVRNSPFTSPGTQTSHLVKLERNNATLLVENNNLKSLNNSLNEQIKKLESHNSELHSHNALMQSQTGSLQSKNANLQVEKATLQAKCDSLQSQNTSLQKQLSDIEMNHKKFQQLHSDLKHSHDQLILDHQTFQKIHDQTTAEYEALISEHGSLKSIHKTLKNENRDLQQQVNNLIQCKDDDNKMREFLNQLREQLQTEKRSLSNLKVSYDKLCEDHERLKDEHENVKSAKNVVQREKEDIVMENKKMKQEYNLLQQDNVECREKLRLIETDIKHLVDKYDALYENYQIVFEEKEQLMNQLERLIQKNQELLNHVLGSKDQMAGQEKSYLEQLSDLRRQKERLEEKIMEHYKQRDKQKKSKGFGAMLLQKVRGLKRSKSRPNLTEGSPDSSSLGSGSFVEQEGDNSRKTDKRRYRRRRGSIQTTSLRDSPGLLKGKRALAKSTTALNSSPSSDPRKIVFSDLRGTRSTEDLLSDTLRSHGDSVSLSNSTFMLYPGMGRPASDDEGGFRSHAGATSPEFLTLEEFLAEGLEKPSSSRPVKKIELKQEDTESRSSENSDSSARRRRPAPLPPTNQNRNRIGSIPDVAAVSNDLSLSRMSRVSTGSSGSSQDIRPESAFVQVTSPSINMQPNNTSTPAKSQTSHMGKPMEELNNSAFSRVFPPDDHRNTSNYDHRTPNRLHHNNDLSDCYTPHYPQSTQESTSERENRIPAENRLDILTRGQVNNNLSPPSPQGMWSPNSNYSSPRDQRSQDEDMSIRSGPVPSPHQSWGRGQTPGSNQRPMRAYPQSPASTSQQITSPTSPQKKSNILVSRANVTPRPYNGQKNVSRIRPASAFGAPNTFHGDYSPNTSLNNSRSNRSDLNNSMLNQSQSSLDNSYSNGPVPTSQHNGPTPTSKVTRRQLPVNRVERPKSVPPTMFNIQGGSDSDTNYNSNTEDYSSNNTGTRGTPPVPPPRKNRDILTSGRYSVLREPSSPTKPHSGSSNKNFLNNSTSAGVQRPPSVPLSVPRSASKQSNKPPAPKPMKPEEGEAKENSIWRQKRVTFDIDSLPESIIP